MASTKSQIAKLLEPAPPVESLIAEGFNEELGSSQTTTLLPLDLESLQFMCRLYLPGVPLERLSVSESFLDEPLGFQQVVSFSCGTELRPFQVAITQCTSHVDAIKAMKRAMCGMTYVHDARGLEAVKDKKLGNYAVKSEDDTFTNGEPSVDIQALATALDSALKSHKGTIIKVPKAGMDENFRLPWFDDVHETQTIKVKFEDGIHDVREYRIIQDEKACVVEDDATSMYGNNGYAGGRFRSDLEVTFHKKEVLVKIAFLMAHKSSLWPVREEFILDDLVDCS
ncbi:hypothetical protein N0V85_003896 [Neurospora sp. IMI 360204]|nr:hypothetical protein N0V85_003896 [Neurospora sp. IMI 360204]